MCLEKQKRLVPHRSGVSVVGIASTMAFMSLLALPAVVTAQDLRHPFTVQDYFRLKRVMELAMSSDGRWVAYMVQSPVFEQDSIVRKVFVQSLEPGSSPVAIEDPDDVRALQWMPRTRSLCFLSSRNASTQVFCVDSTSTHFRQLTQSSDPVISFRFSSNGAGLAYRTRRPSGAARSLASRLRGSRGGLLIDTRTIGINDFLESAETQPTAWKEEHEEPSHLFLTSIPGSLTEIEVPGDVQDFHWSSDGRQLSVTYIASDVPWSVSRDEGDFSSVGIVDTKTGRFDHLFDGQPSDSTGRPSVGYADGIWVSHEGRLFVQKRTLNDPWLREHFPEWALVPIRGNSTAGSLTWHPMEDVQAECKLASPTSILVEDILRARRGLFVLDASGEKLSTIMASVNGSGYRFSFSDDQSRAAFVNEGVTTPPEIYLWERRSGRTRRVSDLNSALSDRQMPMVRKLTWRSTDGVEVEGWLYAPAQLAGSGPQPLLTFVHGGPGAEYADLFAPWFNLWSYPLEVLPTYNIQVFVPNYRGTDGYGRHFNSPSALDAEPLEDVRTGIEELVRRGIADQSRLGIAGHSHGAWLGPMIMTRSKFFKAASFAEGTMDWVLLYDLYDDNFNRTIYDPIVHGSLYDDPQTYLDKSPDFHFTGVHTPMLLEAGSLTSAAILMLPGAKAARRAGAPTEMFSYPRTDHNPTSPQIQREIAERNVDWFRFWLLGQEDLDPKKADQYVRWRDLAKQ